LQGNSSRRAPRKSLSAMALPPSKFQRQEFDFPFPRDAPAARFFAMLQDFSPKL
jgi:hypothetical protein